MSTNKNVYTHEEVDQLKAWFDQAELPAEMQLDKAVYIPDVKETVRRLFLQAYVCCEILACKAVCVCWNVSRPIWRKRKRTRWGLKLPAFFHICEKIRNLHSNEKDYFNTPL